MTGHARRAMRQSATIADLAAARMRVQLELLSDDLRHDLPYLVRTGAVGMPGQQRGPNARLTVIVLPRAFALAGAASRVLVTRAIVHAEGPLVLDASGLDTDGDRLVEELQRAYRVARRWRVRLLLVGLSGAREKRFRLSFDEPVPQDLFHRSVGAALTAINSPTRPMDIDPPTNTPVA